MTTIKMEKDSLAEVHFLLGYVKEKQNEEKEAINHYEIAIEKNDNHVEAHFRLGLSLTKDLEVHTEEIKQHLQRAIELNCEDQANAHLYLGKALLTENEYYEATQNLLQSRGLFTSQDNVQKIDEINLVLENYKGYWYKQAEELDNNRNYEEALKGYENITIIYPDDAKAYCKIGNCYDEQEKYQEAITNINKAIELEKNYAEAYWLRGWIYLHRTPVRNCQQAKLDFQKALEIEEKPKYQVMLEKANFQLSLGEYEKGNLEVVKKWRELIEKLKQLDESHQKEELLAEIELAMNIANHAQGISFGDLIERTQNLLGKYNNFKILDYLRETLAWGQLLIEDAEDLFAKIQPAFTAEQCYEKGMESMLIKAYQEAKDWFIKAINLDSDYTVATVAYCKLGNAYYEIGEVGEAFENWQKSGEIAQNFSRVYGVERVKSLLAEIQLALAVATAIHSNTDMKDLIELVDNARELEERFYDLDFLKKNLVWGDRLFSDTKKIIPIIDILKLKDILRLSYLEYERGDANKAFKQWQDLRSIFGEMALQENLEAVKLLAETSLAINVALFADGKQTKDIVENIIEVLQVLQLHSIDYLRDKCGWGHRLMTEAAMSFEIIQQYLR